MFCQIEVLALMKEPKNPILTFLKTRQIFSKSFLFDVIEEETRIPQQ